MSLLLQREAMEHAASALNARSVLGFLGDFGIGNAMEKGAT